MECTIRCINNMKVNHPNFLNALNNSKTWTVICTNDKQSNLLFILRMLNAYNIKFCLPKLFSFLAKLVRKLLKSSPQQQITILHRFNIRITNFLPMFDISNVTSWSNTLKLSVPKTAPQYLWCVPFIGIENIYELPFVVDCSFISQIEIENEKHQTS